MKNVEFDCGEMGKRYESELKVKNIREEKSERRVGKEENIGEGTKQNRSSHTLKRGIDRFSKRGKVSIPRTGPE